MAIFQELIHQKFGVAVGRLASILALAVFGKGSHQKLSTKFSTFIGPIAANGDEFVFDDHNYNYTVTIFASVIRL